MFPLLKPTTILSPNGEIFIYVAMELVVENVVVGILENIVEKHDEKKKIFGIIKIYIT